MLCGMSGPRSSGTNDMVVDIATPRETNIMALKKDLAQTLSRLPVHNRDLLMVSLNDLLKLSHLYCDDWRRLEIDVPLVSRVVDLIRRYESNGLQLHGDGVRILNKIADHSRGNEDLLMALSEAPVVELLLRLALEHPVYDACLAVLDIVAETVPAVLGRICDIGLSIVEELPLPLPAVGFLALADFLMRQVTTYPSTVPHTGAVLRMLAGLVIQVETNFAVHHFRTLFKAFFTRMLTEKVTLDASARVAVFNVMKGLVVINPAYALDLFEDGLLGLAVDNLLDSDGLLNFSKWQEGDEEVYVAALRFLLSMLVFGDDIDCALYYRGLYDDQNVTRNREQRVRPGRLLPTCPQDHPLAFEAVVELCAVLYGSRLIDDTSEPASVRDLFVEDHVEYVSFVDATMRGVLALLELYDGDSMMRACNIVILLSRHSKGILGFDCNGPINCACVAAGVTVEAVESVLTTGGINKNHQLTITDIIASCRGLLVEYVLDDFDNFDLDYACVVDAMAVLSGWSFNFWDPLASGNKKTPVLNDDEVKQVMSAISLLAHPPTLGDSTNKDIRRGAPPSFALGSSIDMVSRDFHPNNKNEASEATDPEIRDMIVHEKMKRKSQEMSQSLLEDSLLSVSATTHSQSCAENALDILQGVLCDSSDIVDNNSNTVSQRQYNDLNSSCRTDTVSPEELADHDTLPADVETDSMQPHDLSLPNGVPFERQVSKLVTETSSRSLMERVLASKSVLDDWELESTEVLCRYMLLLLSASRCVSCSWLLTVFSRDKLLEILAELLTDERHGLNTYPLMEEKFIQLFADLCCADPTELMEPTLAVYEHISNILGDWNNLKMISLIENCVSALIVLASTNKTVQRRAVAVLEKINVAVWRAGKDRLLEPALALTAVLGEYFNRLDVPSEQLLVGWVVAGLRCPLMSLKKSTCSSTNQIYDVLSDDPTTQIPFRICRIFSRLRSVHPQVMYRTLSRREVEVPIISILLKLIRWEIGPIRDMYRHGRVSSPPVTDGFMTLAGVTIREEGPDSATPQAGLAASMSAQDVGYFMIPTPEYGHLDPTAVSAPSTALIIVLRACLACLKDMNLRPVWFGERWSFHWSFMDRYLLSREFSDLIFLLWHHYMFIEQVEVRSLCLGILVAIADKVRQNPSNNTPVRPPGKAAANILLNTNYSPTALEKSAEPASTSKNKSPTKQRRSWSSALTFSAGPPKTVVIVPISKMLPLLAISLSQFTKGIEAVGSKKNETELQFFNKDESNGKADSLNVVARQDGSTANRTTSNRSIHSQRERSLSTQQQHSAEQYAINSEAVLHTMEGLKLFLCNEDDQTILSQHQHYFASTPLCESILFLMDLYPAVNVIQKTGLSLLLYLCKSDSVNIDILGEHCRGIIAAVISFPTDQMVHYTFCTLVLLLAQRSEKHRNALLFHAIYKWLFIPIKLGWEDVTPIACRAVAAVADTSARAEMVGMARLCEVLVGALGKHKDSVALQIDGFRAVLALAKSPTCINKMRSSGGKKILMSSRRLLMKIASGESVVLPPGYEHNDLIELLSSTNNFPGLFDKDKCAIS